MVIVFVYSKEKVDLDHFVSNIQGVFGCATEKRESDFYLSGYYYKIKYQGMDIKISESDDEEFSDYDFSIVIRGSDAGSFAHSIAEILAMQGFKIAIPESAFKGAPVKIYTSPSTFD